MERMLVLCDHRKMKLRSGSVVAEPEMSTRSLQIADLHPSYATASPEEAVEMANLGAAAYGIVRERLHASWTSSMGAGEAAKADRWQAEGRLAAVEELKAQLGAAEGLSVRLAAAEGTVDALRASIESEVSRRLVKEVDAARKDYDLVKMQEMSALKEQLASAASAELMIQMVSEAHESMKGKILYLEEQRALLQTQLLEATLSNTKSSHVIGKQGEASVLELLEETVLPAFHHSMVKDMTSVKHAADFHLYLMSAHGTHVKILIDSKKYKQVVNSAEINKLNADVDADDDAQCGMMISLDSAISTTKQFQVKFTAKKKPVLYLTFQDMSLELRKEVICWAVQSLLAIVGEVDQSSRNLMLENIELFLAGIDSSVKEIDNVIRGQVKVIEGMRQVKSSIIQKISAYRECDGDNIEIINDDIPVSEDSTTGGCVTILKTTGLSCGKSVYLSTNKCKHHTSKKNKGPE